MNKIFLYASILSFALAGCAHGPYQTGYIDASMPKIDAPNQFEHAINLDTDPIQEKWWEVFNDPQLNNLVEDVILKNPDLAQAGLRIEKALSSRDLANLGTSPTYSGNIDAGKTAQAKDGSVHSSSSFSLRGAASYELDIWGKLKAAKDIASWEASATEADRDATRLSIITAAIQYYWQIAYTHEQIDHTQASIVYAQKLLDIVKQQHALGSASGIDVAESEQNLNGQIAALASSQQQLITYQEQLSLLLDGEKWAPEAIEIPDISLSPIAPGLPASVLAHRPDMRAAELRLRESLGQVEISRLAMYPDITLTGSLGTSSTDLLEILRNPVLALGAGITMPFLNLQENELNHLISHKDYEIAVIDYRKIFLQALTDIDTALANEQSLNAQEKNYKDSLDAAVRAEQRYHARYDAGVEPLRVWLDAQEKQRAAQLAYDNARLNQLINRVTIYQALGGGDSSSPLSPPTSMN